MPGAPEDGAREAPEDGPAEGVRTVGGTAEGGRVDKLGVSLEMLDGGCAAAAGASGAFGCSTARGASTAAAGGCAAGRDGCSAAAGG